MQNYIVVILAAIVSVSFPIMAQMYADKKNNWYWPIMIILSIILFYMYIYLCRQYGATRMYTMIKIMAILLVTLVGYFYFQNKITTKNVIGILFGIVALYLLSNGHNDKSNKN